MRKPLWIGGLLIWLCVAGAAQAKLTIYYLRHAEAGHNVVNQFANVPTNQWPAYVGKANLFTPLGEAQVRGVATNLLAYRFDFIAVSPMWRTRNTILPFLQATGQTAEVWPELAETGYYFPGSSPAPLKVVTGTRALKLTAEEQATLKLRTDRAGCCELGATNWVEAAGLAKQAIDLLRARFGTNDVTVLLVGHGNAGATFIRYLTQSSTWKGGSLSNATLWMAEEQPDGAFELKLFNGAPYPPRR